MAKPAPLAPIIRQILTADPSLTADQVIQRCRTRGVTVATDKLRSSVHEARRDLRKKMLLPTAPVAPPTPVAATAPVRPATPPANEDAVLRNVTLVGTVTAECGGVESVRRVAEAVRTCGGVDGFLKYLDVVVGIPKSA